MAKILDDIDRKLIALLRANARMPLVGLAHKIGLSRSATQERLKRLETNAIIKGYTISFADPAQTAVRAWISLKFAPGYSCDQVVPGVLVHPEVRLCHAIAGPIDLLILAEAADHGALSALRDALVGQVGVAEASTAPVLIAHFG
jgi:Lrp/AsnC family transcriptional regulator, leucine-responsive regulatory protein